MNNFKDELANEKFYSYRKSEIGEYICHKKPKSENKKNPSHRFKIEEEALKLKWKFPKGRASIKHLTTPDTLVNICSLVIEKISIPPAFWWNNTEILKWIENLGFPEYMGTFFENRITGQKLLFLNAKDLEKINIHRFEDVLKITKSIRSLYGIEIISYARSISLPPSFPYTNFLNYRGCTGYKYSTTSIYNVFRKMNLLPNKLYEEHWELLHKNLINRRWPFQEHTIVGNSPRYKLYKVNVEKISLEEKASFSSKKVKCDCVLLPCTCDRTYNDPPRTKPYKYMYHINKNLQQRSNLMQNNNNTSCHCLVVCNCNVNIGNAPKTLSFLQHKIPNKYEKIEILRSIPTISKKKRIFMRKSLQRKSILTNKNT